MIVKKISWQKIEKRHSKKIKKFMSKKKENIIVKKTNKNVITLNKRDYEKNESSVIINLLLFKKNYFIHI